MTDGSSQGLFVVVAVVIFGIFVAISYSLFRDTLTPSLASIFTQAIEQSENSIYNWKIIHEDKNFSLWGTPVYTARPGTKANVDSSVTYEGNNSLKVDFGYSSEGEREGKNDFVLWLDDTLPLMEVGEKVQISFYIRSERNTEIGTRFGGTIYGHKLNSKVTDDWQKVTLTDTVTNRHESVRKPAIVFYSNTPDTFWLSNITVMTNN